MAPSSSSLVLTLAVLSVPACLSDGGCDPEIRRRYCSTRECLSCDVGPTCPVRGPRAPPEFDGRGTLLVRGFSDGSKSDLLRLLNERRRRTTFSNCAPVFEWDGALAELAQAWADQCALVEYDKRRRSPRRLHHDDRERRATDDFSSEEEPTVAQSVHWTRRQSNDTEDEEESQPTAEALEALLASDVSTQDGLVDGVDFGDGSGGVIRWGHATHVGCGWIGFSLDGGVTSDNFMVCNYGVGKVNKTNCDEDEEEADDGDEDAPSFITYYSATSQVIKDVKECLRAVRCRRRQLGDFDVEDGDGDDSTNTCSTSVDSCLTSPSGFKLVPLSQLRRSFFARSSAPASEVAAFADVEASRCKIDTILCRLNSGFSCRKRVGRCLPLILEGGGVGLPARARSGDIRRPPLHECECLDGLILADGSVGDCRAESSRDGRPFCYVRRSPCIALGEGGRVELSAPEERLGSLVHFSHLACQRRRPLEGV